MPPLRIRIGQKGTLLEPNDRTVVVVNPEAFGLNTLTPGDSITDGETQTHVQFRVSKVRLGIPEEVVISPISERLDAYGGQDGSALVR